jgi:hypothetical protein
MKIDLSKVSIGSDFELFIQDESNKFISAIPFIEGDKENPQVISDTGHAIQADGALFEANVPPVSLNEGYKMWEDIQYVIENGKQRLPEGLKIICCTNAKFTDDQLTDPKARLGGCDPDYNAWNNGKINKKPDLASNNDRCCGFHIHVSFPKATPQNVMRLVRILDVNIALYLLFVDEDRTRRKLYGKAGAFRFKDYGSVGGVEYRSLSNAVIKSQEIFNTCFDALTTSISEYNKGIDYLEYGDQIQEAINSYNLDLADQLLEKFKKVQYAVSI